MLQYSVSNLLIKIMNERDAHKSNGRLVKLYKNFFALIGKSALYL